MKAHADAHGQKTVGFPFFIVFIHHPVHRNGRHDRIIGAFGKKGHDAVPVILVNESMMLLDDRAHAPQIPVDKLEVVLGRHGLGEGCIAANVGKHNRHLLLDLVSQPNFLDAFFIQQTDEFPRHEPFINAVQFGQFLGPRSNTFFQKIV